MRALWSGRQNRSHNLSQQFKRIRRFPDIRSRLQISGFRLLTDRPINVTTDRAIRVFAITIAIAASIMIEGSGALRPA